MAALSVLLAQVMPTAGQGTGAVRLDVEMGSVGSVTEFFRTPLVGQPRTEPDWKPEWRPDGSRPPFPPGARPPLEVIDGDRTPGLTAPAAVWAGVPAGGQVATSDTQVPLPAVLFPIEVFANRAWQSTGVVLNAGQAFEIAAAGRWSMHRDERWCSADGIARDGPLGQVVTQLPNHPSPICPLPLHPAGTLAGRIAGGTPFRIGIGGRFTAPAAGLLELMPNDVFDSAPAGQPCPHCNDPFGHLWNNEGALTVVVTTR